MKHARSDDKKRKNEKLTQHEFVFVISCAAMRDKIAIKSALSLDTIRRRERLIEMVQM